VTLLASCVVRTVERCAKARVARTRSRRPEGATDRRSPLDLPRHEWQGWSAAWAALRQRSALRD